MEAIILTEQENKTINSMYSSDAEVLKSIMQRYYEQDHLLENAIGAISKTIIREMSDTIHIEDVKFYTSCAMTAILLEKLIFVFCPVHIELTESTSRAIVQTIRLIDENGFDMLMEKLNDVASSIENVDYAIEFIFAMTTIVRIYTLYQKHNKGM